MRFKESDMMFHEGFLEAGVRFEGCDKRSVVIFQETYLWIQEPNRKPFVRFKESNVMSRVRFQ